jgi:ribonuclease P protein component
MFQFFKQEHLTNHKIIDHLFKEGKSVFVYPFKIIWCNANYNSLFPAQVLFSVPKKIFKRAVKRNSIRRKIKEAYRLNKNAFYTQLNINEKKIALAIIYLSKDDLPFTNIQSKLLIGISNLIAQLEDK